MKEQTALDGKPVTAVLLTTAKGVQIKMYFDAGSGLLTREEFPQSKIYDYSDFRTIDGVQEPFMIRSSVDGETYEIKVEEIKHNQQIAKTAFDFPNLSTEPLPDIPSLLKDVQANEDRIEQLLENYTYTQINTSRAVDKSGKLSETESETFQVTFYKGNKISRLTAKDGRPLDSDKQQSEDKRVVKLIEEIDKKLAKKQGQNSDDEDNDKKVSIAETLRASHLTNPRRERFRGRDVIVFDFEPNPDFDYKKAKSAIKFFGKTAGAMWIDAEDKQVARIEAFLVDNFKAAGGLANLKKGASFSLEKERINDEIWLPSVVDLNIAIKLFFIKGLNFNQLIKYGNYERFKTEVNDSKVNAPNKP